MKIEPALSAARLRTAAASADGTCLRAPRRPLGRRLAFWLPVVSATLLGTALGAVATAGIPSPARWPLLLLLAANLFYLALTGTPAIIGVVLHALRRRFVAEAAPTGLSRTALLMPVYNEDPRAVFAAVESMARAIAESGLPGVDLFVLSDTQRPAVIAAEEAEWAALQDRVLPGVSGGVLGGASGAPRLFYRRRPQNTGRKTGNLAEFCERWGAEYDYMLVLDADSLMGPDAVARLIGLMDANPRTGIIQTVPYAVGRETAFARLQQFAARLYTPLLVEGLTFWQASDGNYWGHNAIIRVAPFVAHCTLPVLPGAEPWGGEILCHDVVEAGLMRGAGWDVWVLPQVEESYEAVPANAVDFASRERRWCQGNLQHKAVLPLPGLRPVGRFHLAYGIAHYLAGPAAALFLGGAAIDGALGGGFGAALLAGGAGAGLVVLGAVLLYAGKLLTLLAVLLDREESARFGGRLPLLAGAALEQAAALVVAPLLILSYTRYVWELLRGQAVRWDAQARDDRGVSWSEAWMRTRFHALSGLAWLALTPFLPAVLAWWTAPLLLGTLLVTPFAVWSSRTDLGTALRRRGLLVVPEERAAPPILRAYARVLAGSTPAERPRAAPPPASPSAASPATRLQTALSAGEAA